MLELTTNDREEIHSMLKDQGSYIPLFMWFYDAGVPLMELQQLYIKIKTYRELLRTYRINPFDVYKPKRFNAQKQYELLLDMIDGAISETAKINFAHSFISKKYIKLLNNSSIEVLWKMKDELHLTRQQIQNLIFDKLAAYKYAEEFERSLKDTFNNLTKGTWNVEYVKLMLKEELIDIVYSDNWVVIGLISNFNQCKSVGPRSWCITRSKSTFDMYTRKGTQYIIYDTKKDRTVGDAIVGFTAKTRHSVSYNQFDKPYDWKVKLVKYFSYLKCQSVDAEYVEDDEYLKQRIFKDFSNYKIDQSIIDGFETDTIDVKKIKKHASYIKNMILSAALLLKKNNIIDEMLKDKNVNVNSNCEFTSRIDASDMLIVAIYTKDFGSLKKLMVHRSCRIETKVKTLLTMIGKKNKEAIRVLCEEFKTETDVKKMLLLAITMQYRYTFYYEDSNIEDLLNIFKPSQHVVNEILTSLRGMWQYNRALSAAHKCGYGKNFSFNYSYN